MYKKQKLTFFTGNPIKFEQGMIVCLISYPRATSSIIMIMKPTIKLNVARSVLLLAWESGISSSTTTNIIAPAANANAYGSMGVIINTAAAPIVANIGSTIADACP